jgi:3-oxoacyl-[acyl-carrier-protein] synthase-3
MSMQGGVVVGSRIIGWGKFTPERVVPNSFFESYLDTNDQWITERTGIRERRWADESVGASDLGAEACKAALARAGLSPNDIDGIICATATPDSAFPNTACLIQHKIGAPSNLAFDVSAACTGFVYALTTADAMIRAGQCKNVLVVGTEVFSSIIDQQDRSTCILFGDGAGAVVLSAVPEEERSGSLLSTRGIFASELRADGSKGDILYSKLGSAFRMTEERFKNRDYFVHMEGREVFKFAVRALADVSNNLLGRMEVSLADVDWIISHQANQRIVAGMAKALGVDESKVPSNVSRYGNTSAASIPLLLSELADEGRLQEGQLVLVNGVGGGMTWGATLLRW